MTGTIVCLLGCLIATQPVQKSTKPNVILILSDDQSYTDYGFMGHNTIQTPNLDRLADESIVFLRGYVVNGLCRPSLASMMTGLYPHQHGVVGNDVSPARGMNRKKENQGVIDAFNSKPSIVRSLVSNGYNAFQSGKWWEGSWKDGGFTHGMTHGDHTKGGRHGDEGLKIGRQGLKPIEEFIDESIADEKPFFIWYAPFLPHTPHNPPKDLLKKYEQEGRPNNVAKYFAMCEWFDQTCGDLFQMVDDKGLSDNTVIVYIADNGWVCVDKKADNPKGWWPAYAPKSKGSPYEKGIRTPIMFKFPSNIKPQKSFELASSIDLFPTIASICKVDVPDGLPGIDLTDEEKRSNRESIYGATYATHNMTPGNPNATLQYRWCIHKNWKLLLRGSGSETTSYRVLHEWDTEAAHLFDLENDPDELKDVVNDHADLVERMTKMIDKEIPAESTN